MRGHRAGTTVAGDDEAASQHHDVSPQFGHRFASLTPALGMNEAAQNTRAGIFVTVWTGPRGRASEMGVPQVTPATGGQTHFTCASNQPAWGGLWQRLESVAELFVQTQR